MKAPEVLILGCGFTGQRVANLLVGKGVRVIAASRNPRALREKMALAEMEIIPLQEVSHRAPRGVLVLHSIPPAPAPENGLDILKMLGHAPARVVYLSSTAVYGGATIVNESTLVDANSPKAYARLAAEQVVANGPWSSLILRPAAIYGPGRGVQESMRRGSYVLGDNFVSRIHVDDLATHAEAALFSSVSGAFPVADEEPCTTREIGEFCAHLLGLEAEIRTTAPVRQLGNRRVDGSAIRRALGLTLKFPSYRSGVPAALAGE